MNRSDGIFFFSNKGLELTSLYAFHHFHKCIAIIRRLEFLKNMPLFKIFSASIDYFKLLNGINETFLIYYNKTFHNAENIRSAERMDFMQLFPTSIQKFKYHLLYYGILYFTSGLHTLF